MNQDAASLDVAEEAVAQLRAFMRALDQARNVGDGEAVVIDRHGAELGLERGERVIGDLARRDTAARKVDLPALGRPTRPASASGA